MTATVSRYVLVMRSGEEYEYLDLDDAARAAQLTGGMVVERVYAYMHEQIIWDADANPA